MCEFGCNCNTLCASYSYCLQNYLCKMKLENSEQINKLTEEINKLRNKTTKISKISQKLTEEQEVTDN